MNFGGFQKPEQNWFKLPNEWTNFTAGMETWAEQKVVEYVLRHTWGFQEYDGVPKKITTDEFMNGRKHTDGTRIDQGVGMGKKAVIDGLRQAVEDGFLIEEVDSGDRARIKKYYGLRMRDDIQMFDNRTPGVRSPNPWSMETEHRSEKDTLERNLKKETVTNGHLKYLPDLDQPTEKTDYVAEAILNQLGDRHSEKFYHLVAAKIPEDEIRRVLSEIRVDGAREPAKVFTYRMNQYAQQVSTQGQHLQKTIGK